MTSSSPIDLTFDDKAAHLTPRSAPEREEDGSVSHPSKRAGVEANNEETVHTEEAELGEDLGESEEDNCSICLHHVDDRTVIPNCSHDFCFECLLVWTGAWNSLMAVLTNFSSPSQHSGQSRRCPLCNQPVGEYVIHNIRSRFDYQKHFLPPLKSSSPTPQREQQTALQNVRQRAARRRRERRRDVPHDEMDEADRLERSIQKRRWIYEHDLYASPFRPSSQVRTTSQFLTFAGLMVYLLN
ncbi:hypothetical protein NMY22_g17134 [Coprinellus aureogranulatus]|nr:hypothetical protein NMY22_g17134 [Coprinellus aureogranulatus]